MGCDGVLLNSAVAHAQKPVLMASAMKKAIEAGREAFLAGRMPRKAYASASSPLDGPESLVKSPLPAGKKKRRHSGGSWRQGEVLNR